MDTASRTVRDCLALILVASITRLRGVREPNSTRRQSLAEPNRIRKRSTHRDRREEAQFAIAGSDPLRPQQSIRPHGRIPLAAGQTSYDQPFFLMRNRAAILV